VRNFAEGRREQVLRLMDGLAHLYNYMRHVWHSIVCLMSLVESRHGRSERFSEKSSENIAGCQPFLHTGPSSCFSSTFVSSSNDLGSKMAEGVRKSSDEMSGHSSPVTVVYRVPCCGGCGEFHHHCESGRRDFWGPSWTPAPKISIHNPDMQTVPQWHFCVPNTFCTK